MISYRYARYVKPHYELTSQVGRVVHTGPGRDVEDRQRPLVRRVITIDCRTCAHCDALHYAPAALVTVERWI